MHLAMGVPRVAAVLFASALVVASCGGTAPGAPAAASPAAPAATDAPGTLPKPEKTSVKVGYSALSGAGSGPAIILRQNKIYEKYGVTMEVVQFSSPTQSMQALLAGQIDISDSSAAPVLATIGTSSHSQIVFVPRANNSDILYGQKDVKTANDLRGKTVAISSFGSNSYAGAIYGLRALGLTAKDVTLTTVGSDTQRLAALKSGAVAASVQDNTLEKDLNAQGFNSLVRMGDIRPPVGQPGTSTVVPVEFQKKFPNTVLAVVAAQLEANNTFRIMPPKDSAPILAKELKDIPLPELERQIALVQQEPWTPKDGSCRAQDIAFAKEIAVSANAALANVDALLACNNQFIDLLKKLGFHKKLGIPES